MKSDAMYLWPCQGHRRTRYPRERARFGREGRVFSWRELGVTVTKCPGQDHVSQERAGPDCARSEPLVLGCVHPGRLIRDGYWKPTMKYSSECVVPKKVEALVADKPPKDGYGTLESHSLNRPWSIVYQVANCRCVRDLAAGGRRSQKFGAESIAYELANAPTPEQIFADIVETGELKPGARVIEIGAGIGIATVSLVSHDLQVTAIEPAPAMRELAHERLGDKVHFVSGRFEDWTPIERVDLITTVSAWRRVEPGQERTSRPDRFHQVDRWRSRGPKLSPGAARRSSGNDRSPSRAVLASVATPSPGGIPHASRSPGKCIRRP
jgi:Ribosomal RNA adenine dimethylase